MKLSAPIYHLKRNARQLARKEGIKRSAALERIAVAEGYPHWSLLAAKYASTSPAARLYAGLEHGDMLLVGARPGQGKTLLALEIAAEAVKHGKSGMFFTLEYTKAEVLGRLALVGLRPGQVDRAFKVDCSDDICADYIIERALSAEPGTVVAIDYLQLMDQKRSHPPLAEQITALKSFAERSGVVIVLISQIARTYDPAVKAVPDLSDVRLPNPVDLALFTKTHFIGNHSAASDVTSEAL